MSTTVVDDDRLNDRLIGPKEICDLIGVQREDQPLSDEGLNAMIRRGELPPPIRFGQFRRWWRSEVFAALKRHEPAAAARTSEPTARRLAKRTRGETRAE
jgi:predicted DNA-binding transcriptional regulator AlpA